MDIAQGASTEKENTDMTADVQTPAPTKAELEKAVVEAKSALDKATVEAGRILAEQAAKGADADFSAVQSAAGAKTRAENSHKAAVQAVKDFDANARWTGLRDTNRPVIDLLSASLKSKLDITPTSIRGSAVVLDSGEVEIHATYSYETDMSALEAKIAALVKAGLAAYKTAGVTEMSFSADSKGVSIGPKSAAKVKNPGTPRAASAPVDGLSVKNFDSVASAEEQAELDMILEAEKGTSSNSKSYAFKMRVVKAHAA